MAEYVRDGADRSMTRGEAASLCGRAAGRIPDRTGCRGRWIGLYGENSPGWIILFWAILRSGNKPCLLNTVQPREANRRFLAALGADAVLYTGSAPGFADKEISLEELTGGEEDADRRPDEAFGNEIAVTTSGTTLQEKVCVFTGREISEQVMNCGGIIRTNPGICKPGGGIRMLMLLPLYHVFGLEATFLWFALAEAVYVFPPDRKPATILRTIRDRQVTHVFAVPLFWQTAEKELRRGIRSRAEAERERFDRAVRVSVRLQSLCPTAGRAYAGKAFRSVRKSLLGDSVRFCITGGSPVRRSTLELFNALGYPLYNGYGTSETGITSVELSRSIRDRLKNSVGKPFRSVSYRIDEGGRLLISGASVSKTLYIDGRQAEPSEWFRSGDFANRDGSGRYYITGRESDLVSGSTGEKLNPDTAEKAFTLPWAEAFSVLGDRDNERLIMVVQIPEGLVDIQKKQIRDAFGRCNNTLPMVYRVGKVYYTHDRILPEGGIKVSRAELRRRMEDGSIRLLEAGAEDGGGEDGNGSDVKEIIRAMIAEVLSVSAEQVPDDAHFILDLGGSSLDYLTLVSMIDNRFGITLDYEGEGSGYSLNDLARSTEERLCC